MPDIVNTLAYPSGLGPLLNQKLHNGVKTKSLGAIESASAIRADGVDSNAKVRQEFHRLEHQSFALITLWLNPGSTAAHSSRGHQRCNHLIVRLHIVRYILGLVNKQ